MKYKLPLRHQFADSFCSITYPIICSWKDGPFKIITDLLLEVALNTLNLNITSIQEDKCCFHPS
jgi:hypothetical protein